jgi:hypothetical protein
MFGYDAADQAVVKRCWQVRLRGQGTPEPGQSAVDLGGTSGPAGAGGNDPIHHRL